MSARPAELPFPEDAPDAARWRRVARVDELPREGGLLAVVDGRPIGVFRLAGGDVRAVGDRCTHVGAPLHEGRVEGRWVWCPLHAARFDLDTGRALDAPAPCDTPVHRVRVVRGEVWVEREPRPVAGP